MALEATAEQANAAPLIVHVVRQFLPNRGGLEDVVANLARETVKRGYRVRVVTLDTLFTARDRKLPSHEIIDGIDVVRIPWSGSTRYPIAPQVLRHLADADLVHVHAIDFFFDALALSRVLHRRPMVATTHGGFFHTQKHAALKKIWFQTLTRFSAMNYKRVVGCSASDIAQFSQIAGNTVLIENGVDIGKFADSASRQPHRRIVTIGRFSVNKRLDHLLDAMQVLAARDPEWHLDIVGSESDLKGADLTREIAARGLDRAVGLHVGIANPEIRSLISAASLFASASEYEGFGLVALEAMSAGLYPVLNRNAAYLALAERKMPLSIADFSDPENAAAALEQAFAAILTEPAAMRDALIASARPYSWDHVAGLYIDLYRSLGIPAFQRIAA
ncbi:glycosyltransferase family 4 protein [Rhizobium sp. SIMBA_035]